MTWRMTLARAYVDVVVAVMTSEMMSAGNLVAREVRGSACRNFGRCMRARGSSNVEVSSGFG